MRILVLFLPFLFVTPLYAQDAEVPEGIPFSPQSVERGTRDAAAVSGALEQKVKEGGDTKEADIQAGFVIGKFEEQEKGEFGPHPWLGSMSNPGRPAMESAGAYLQDSMIAVQHPQGMQFDPANQSFVPAGGDLEKFQKCFEPRFVFPMCPWCFPIRDRFDNSPSLGKVVMFGGSKCPKRWNNGFIYTYRWPETIVETGEYGLSAVNPGCFGRPDLHNQILSANSETELRAALKEDEIEEALPYATSLATAAGGSRDLSGLQFSEAHVYKSFVADYASKKGKKSKMGWVYRKVKFFFGPTLCLPNYPLKYNGYKSGNPDCFLATTGEEEPIVNAYTEEMGGLNENAVYPIWRFGSASEAINSELYSMVVPDIELTDPKLVDKGREFLESKTCRSHKFATYPDEYQDLIHMGVMPALLPRGDEICNKYTEPTFPLVGFSNERNPFTHGALIMRRALFITEAEGGKQVVANRTNAFSMEADKLQVIHPYASECFGMQDIDSYNKELFPLGANPTAALGSVRYMMWNQRVACTCQYHGTHPIEPLALPLSLVSGNGCHNYKRAPFTIPIDPVIKSITAVFGNAFPAPMSEKEAKGDVYNQTQEGVGPFPPWPDGWPLDAAALLPAYIRQYADFVKAIFSLPGQILDTVETISQLPETIGNVVTSLQDNFGNMSGVIDDMQNLVETAPLDFAEFASNVSDGAWDIVNNVSDLEAFQDAFGPPPPLDEWDGESARRFARSNQSLVRSNTAGGWSQFLEGSSFDLASLGEAAELLEGISDVLSIGGLFNAIGLPSLPSVWDYTESARQVYEEKYFAEYDPTKACAPLLGLGGIPTS